MRGISKHLEREIEVSHERGRPLDPGEPVPGCDCPTCVMQDAGLAGSTFKRTRAIVRKLARLHPDQRMAAAQYAVNRSEIALPSADWMCRLAEKEHGARRAYRGPDLPVDAAREVSILDAAERLGIELKKMGLSHRAPCPIHGGEGMNFAVRAKKGKFKCFVCDASGDVIDLVMQVRGCTFAAAVRELAG